jgi:hypothetical protein
VAAVDDSLGAGEVRLDFRKLGELHIQFVLQRERLAQPRLEAGQPRFRAGDATELL